MTKALFATLITGSALIAPAQAHDYGQYSAPVPFPMLPRSALTGQLVPVPPYGLMPIRVYSTPQTGPYFNVPPYAVIAPY